MYYVYVLRCSDNSLYTSITTDFERRFDEHKNKTSKGAKYTRSREVVEMVGLWQTDCKVDASKLEFHFKRLSKNSKEIILREPEKIISFLGEKIETNKFIWIKDSV